MKRRRNTRKPTSNRVLLLMLFPSILFFGINSYLPMIGIYYAFVRFEFNKDLFALPFVGLDNFEFLWKSGQLFRLTLNTIGYNVAFIVLGNALAVVCAVLLGEIGAKWFKKTVQSVMFLPYFVSFVLLSVVVYNLFNFERGFWNTFMRSVGLPPVDVYGRPGIWIALIILFYIWKNIGYTTVIYLAAASSIHPEYYEAAKMDGANVFQRARHITIPLLKPTFVLLLLFSAGHIMKGQFDLFYQLIGNNGLLYSTTDILDTYVFRSLKVTFDVGLATAAGLYQSLFGFAVIMTINGIVRKINRDYALF